MTKEISWLLLTALILTIFPFHMADALTIKTSRKLVILDPGHGGSDSGITSTTGILEKQILLELAKRTQQELNDQYQSLLSRSTDATLSETDRAAFANQNKADLFLSLHLHTKKDKLFFFYFDTPEAVPTNGNPTWKAQGLSHQDKSKQAATLFAKEFQARNKKSKPHFGPAPVISLEGLLMPAILAELFSISNIPETIEEQEVFLASYAKMIARCIETYFETKF